MGGLRKYMPVTAVTFIVGWLAIAGISPFAGFWSKDEILLGAWGHGGSPLWKVLWFVGFVTALLTAYYMSRQVFMVFFGEERWRDEASEQPRPRRRRPRTPRPQPRGDAPMPRRAARVAVDDVVPLVVLARAVDGRRRAQPAVHASRPSSSNVARAGRRVDRANDRRARRRRSSRSPSSRACCAPPPSSSPRASTSSTSSSRSSPRCSRTRSTTTRPSPPSSAARVRRRSRRPPSSTTTSSTARSTASARSCGWARRSSGSRRPATCATTRSASPSARSSSSASS